MIGGADETSPTYPSKVDTWLVLVLAGSLVYVLALGVWLRGTAPEGSLVTFGTAAFLVLVLRLAVFPCRYTLEPGHLLVRAGLLRWRIPYREITAIEPSRNPLSSPALSLQRVKISYRGTYLLVSPRDRERFIAELQARADAARGGL